MVKLHVTKATVVCGSRIYKRNLSQLKKVGSKSNVKEMGQTMLKFRVKTLPDGVNSLASNAEQFNLNLEELCRIK